MVLLLPLYFTQKHIRLRKRLCFGGLLVAISGLFPMLYNTTDEVRSLSATMITVCGIFLVVVGVLMATGLFGRFLSLLS